MPGTLAGMAGDPGIASGIRPTPAMGAVMP